MSVKLTSRLADIARRSQQGAELVDAATARRVAKAARANAPRVTGELADSIEAKDGRVVVGAAHGPHVEFGTAHAGAQPFLVPAAEAARERHQGDVLDLYK